MQEVKSQDQVLQEAVTTYGRDAQIDMCIEECAELIVALRHLQRKRTDERAAITEIADVLVMARQMRILFGADQVDLEVEKKITRLECRMARKR